LEQLETSCPLVKTGRELAQAFIRMVKDRLLAGLQHWLRTAEVSGLRELRTFAASLRRDLAAVEAALSQRWSNGPTEGHVNSLKLIKRQMFGRAKFDLLRQRVLHAV
jgi:transposase